MDDNLFNKLQNDLRKSNPIIINNNDNVSFIKKNLNSKYTEDLSDSGDEISYKNRNINIINKLPSKNNTKTAKNIKKKSNNELEDELKELEELEELEKSNNKKKSKNNIIKNSDEDDKSSDENNSEDESKHEYEYTEEFAKKVKQYVKDDDKIRELQLELKKLNTAKKAAEQDILKHLERLGENNINITGGKLRINQYESKESLKEDIIKEAIGEKIKDPKIIENIFNKINEKRTAGKKIQVSLKRTFERNNAKKK